MNENKKIYKSIGEVAKILNLVNKKNGKLSTHTIRFWEKEFKQIKPFIFSGKRRYYDDKTILILKKIQFLLKNKGMTVKGVKIELQNNDSELDEFDNKTINTKNIKTKLSKIVDIIKSIKNNG
jgi:DNA-binding transcriptional MerR regulator